MDWAAIASILGERADRPIVLLDRAGRIRLFNRAIEQVLGWSRFEVEGELWARTCTPSDRQLEARRWIDDALRGALRGYDVHAVTNNGQRVLFRFEFSLVGKGSSQALLATAQHWENVERGRGVVSGRDLDYEITLAGDTTFALTRLQLENEPVKIPSEDRRCFAVIHDRQQPCEDCPVTRDDGQPWPRVLVRPVKVDQATGFQVVTAEQASASLVRLRIRSVTDHMLEAIHIAKVQQLAERAELSAREREVLMYLLLGRSTEDIATLVGIAERTVKYHQANVLQKLGADSRADLMRLLF